MTDDIPIPRTMTVPCYNATDGCTATVQYLGTKPVHKLCSTCQSCGTPSERRLPGYDFSKAAKACKVTAPTEHMGGNYYRQDGPCVACTVYPKTEGGGRVVPFRSGG